MRTEKQTVPEFEFDEVAQDRAMARTMWWRCFRPSIVVLIETDENYHDAALLLLVPCMEKVYAIEHPQYKNRRVPYGKVVQRFFPYLGEEECDLFRRRVANGLKHDSFIRTEILELKYPGIEQFEHLPISLFQCWISETEVEDFDELPEDEKMSFLVINKLRFWEAVYPQIDEFYGEIGSNA